MSAARGSACVGRRQSASMVWAPTCVAARRATRTILPPSLAPCASVLPSQVGDTVMFSYFCVSHGDGTEEGV